MKDEIEKSLKANHKVSFVVRKPINARGKACGVGSVLTFSKSERPLIARVAGAGIRFVEPLAKPEDEKILPFGKKKPGRPPKAASSEAS